MARIICICGRLFSGSTYAGNVLAGRYGWRVLHADTVGEMILKERFDAFAGDKRTFPYPVHARIQHEYAELFIERLRKFVRQLRVRKLVLLGMRSADAVRSLRRSDQDMGIVYVHTSRETRRLRCGSDDQFGAVEECALEADQDGLPLLADAWVWNDGDRKDFETRLFAIVQRNGQIVPQVDRCALCGDPGDRTGSSEPPLCVICRLRRERESVQEQMRLRFLEEDRRRIGPVGRRRLPRGGDASNKFVGISTSRIVMGPFR